MPMRFLIVLALLAGFGARASAAETPSAEALQAANALFLILSGDMMKQLAAQMTNAFWPGIEQKARAEKIDDLTIGELRKEFERIQVAFLAEAMKEAPPVYARHFTAAELNELTAFYRTPIGAKALREMPQVTGEFTALLAPRLQDVQQQTTEAFNKILREHGYIK
jgi:uncharacterized protein